MSIIDSLNHSVVAYDPKSTKAFTGQRLSKVTYKTVTDKTSALFGIKRDSKCVSLPLVASDDIAQNLVSLTPHIQEFLHGVQDKIVRELVDGGAASVSMEAISIAGCIEWLESQAGESGRLTKESVGVWFSENIETELAVALSEKLGVSGEISNEQSAQIMKVVGTFKDKVSALAGGKTSYPAPLCETLKKALAYAPAGDALAVRFTARLDKMIADSKMGTDLMDLL